MGRTYFRKAALSVCAVGLAAIAGSLPGLARALFDSRPLNQERFAILAQAVGTDRWKLLVLEQIKTRPLCWGICCWLRPGWPSWRGSVTGAP